MSEDNTKFKKEKSILLRDHKYSKSLIIKEKSKYVTVNDFTK